jgi:hypothetical protein
MESTVMLESILVFICFKENITCQENAKAYYEYKPELKVIKNNIEKKIRSISGEKVNKYLYPVVVTLYLNQEFTVPIAKSTYLDTNKNLDFGRLRWTYEF